VKKSTKTSTGFRNLKIGKVRKTLDLNNASGATKSMMRRLILIGVVELIEVTSQT
jgi:hypothetical protein